MVEKDVIMNTENNETNMDKNTQSKKQKKKTHRNRLW